MKERNKTNVCVLTRMLFVAVFLFYTIWTMAQVKVVDGVSGLPVSYASIFDDATGKVLGITNVEGVLPAAADSCKTISVQHINYDPVTLELSSVSDGIIKLASRKAYEVKEVAVDRDNHDYIRLKMYTRDYTVVNGMVAEVSESVGYGYFDNKSRKYKEGQCLTMNHLRNEAAFNGQKMIVQAFAECDKPTYGGRISTSLSFFDKYNDGKKHTLYDKKGVKMVTYSVRHNDAAKIIELVADSALVEKPFNIWLFGISMSDAYGLVTFSSAYGKPSLSTLQNNFSVYRMTHNKSQVSVTVYHERYMLGVDYANKEDYKAIKKELAAKAKAGTAEKFVRPEGVPPFSKYVSEAMKAMTEVKK